MWIERIIDDCYRVDSLVGEGGFGEVYRATDLRLRRVVALKRLRGDRCGPRDLQRFLDEARHLAALNHPNVVRVFLLGEFEGQHYIVMEYLEGTTLAELNRTGVLSTRQRVEVLRHVASGLGALHAIGILHRDLSPNNIMVLSSGEAKILDLGLSRDTAASTTESMHVLRGTLPYLSPEQVMGEPSAVASEVFSFGVVLYEALSGVNPFYADHATSVLYNIAHREPEPLERRAPGCPGSLADLVRSCLAKRPSDRPRSIREVEQGLVRALAVSDLELAGMPRVESGVRASSAAANPYLHRVMIKRREDFYGRRTEIQRIFARLNATPPGSVSIVGDRKIGKSSLLNHVYDTQQRDALLEHPDRMVMVFVDLQGEKGGSVGSFVELVLGLASLELRGRVDLSNCARSLDGIKTMVQRLEAGGYRLALLLDEFEAVTTNAKFGLEFYSFLRFLANHYNVAYLTSSARNLQVLCHAREISDSPFFNIFSTLRLTAFQRPEAEEMIHVPSSRAGHPLERWTDEILALSGLFPFYIQMACAHAFEYLEEHPGDSPDFREIQRRFVEEARMHYRYLWDTFDELEQSALRRLVRGRSIPDSLQHVVDELKDRRYVIGDGQQSVFATPFADFITSLDRQKRPPGLLARWWRR